MRTPLTFDRCEKILASEHYGHLGCTTDGIPYVFPVTYVYKNGYVYSHTTEGTKIDIMRKNPHVCLQVEHVDSGYEWISAMCHGEYQELADPAESHEIQLLLADQYAAISIREGKVPVSPILEDLHLQKSEEIKKSVIYRINIKQTTGVAETHDSKAA